MSTPSLYDQIIDFRYRACRMTITTSNLSPDEIRARFEQTGDWHGRRIIDRLKAMSVVLEVKGRNLREACYGLSAAGKFRHKEKLRN